MLKALGFSLERSYAGVLDIGLVVEQALENRRQSSSGPLGKTFYSIEYASLSRKWCTLRVVRFAALGYWELS